MVFIGGGALLSHAVGHALALGLPVGLVCCPVGDLALPRLARLGVTVFPSDNPNADLSLQIAAPECEVVFSINNRFLLSDVLLASGPRFYNIHNGLVQRYRGLAEVCTVAAICRGEVEYGATLHRLLPGQKVDTGPVVAQQAFTVASEDDFAVVFGRGLDACKRLYEQYVAAIVAGSAATTLVEHAGKAFGYRDVARLCAEASPERRRRAIGLGPYQRYFPALAALLANIDRHTAA
jgi:methionyl-tRNA formyltransferase